MGNSNTKVATLASKTNYSALAAFLSQYPDQFTVLRLRELNTRNLLFYQAELLYLKRQLEDIERDDAQNHQNPEEQVTRAWYPSMAKQPQHKHPQNVPGSNSGVAFQAGSSFQPPPPTPQSTTVHDKYSEKVLEIRETLGKYNEALAHYIQQESLPSPPERTIRSQHEWLKRRDFANSFLAGTTADAWKPDPEGKFHPEEFMAFIPSEGFSFRLAQMFMAIRTHIPSKQSPGRVFSIDSSSQGEIAQGISVVISCVVPVLPIVILFFISSLLVRIGLILVFTAVFAAVLVFGLKLAPEKVLTITLA